MTTKPTIELKSIKLMKTLSEETPCYTAVLHVDGKKFADVSNRGHGGCDSVHGPSNDELKALDQLVAATFPKLDMSDYGRADIDTSLETVCHELVWEWDALNSVTRLVKTKLAFFKELPAEGGADLYTVTLKQFGNDVAKGKAHVLKGAPRAFFLNGLEGAELLAAYRRAN